jgi:DNA repair photolyase
VIRKKNLWGDYVCIRINAAESLENELKLKKPKTVFLGSTTECFQPIEKKYRITEKILGILNKNKIFYNILTRSPDILEYKDLLKDGYCKDIYFTVNSFEDKFKERLEPRSPAFKLRQEAVNTLLEEGISVIPYFSPVLPGISDLKDIFFKFKKAKRIEFECLNFRLNNIRDIIKNIIAVEPLLQEKLELMYTDKHAYEQVWREIEEDIKAQVKEAKRSYKIHLHKFGDFFKNTYDKV